MFKKRTKRKAAVATREDESGSDSGPEKPVKPVRKTAAQERTKLSLAELQDRYFPPDVQAIKEITLEDVEPQDDVSVENDWEDQQLAKSGLSLIRNHESLMLPTLSEISARLDRHVDQLEQRRRELEQIIQSKNNLLAT